MYEPFNKLVKAAKEFSEEVIADIKAKLTDNTTLTASFPEGIPDVSDMPIEVEIIKVKDKWVVSVTNGDMPVSKDDPYYNQIIDTVKGMLQDF